ncbi:ABC transporter ATP-binding protein/permease [Clostridium estertheticum]|uniref:ABC transporter ATP-binding protein n=1 Tax=Clostridium estertheticum TaxID=238834 RepID=UPI001C0B375A|nr:ABC transporter ATP-binding protein [Clostridium estertheticum]MBU3175328.1 ABC transporter ATP-binding protein/permease [Clostridium estertheticum]
MIKLFRFIKQYSLQITAIVVLSFIQVLTNLYLPTLTADIVDKGIVQKNIVHTISFLGFSGSYKGIDYIFRLGVIMLLFAAVSAICAILVSYLSSKTAVGFGRIIRSKMFSKIEDFSQSEFDKLGTATLITRTTNDVTQVQTVTVMVFSTLLFAPLTALGGIIMALQEESSLTWIFAAIIPILAIIISIILKASLPLSKKMQIRIDKLNLVLRESLIGIRVVRAFNRISTEKARFNDANVGLMNNSVKLNKITAFLMPVMMLIMNITTVAIIWFGSKRIDAGVMQIGSLIAFIQYGMQILIGFLLLAMVFTMMPRAQASAIRINEVLAMEPEITDPENTKLANKKRGYVEFKNISFSYPGSDLPAISHINFSVKPGETTAIIGGTGSGKSTLVNLIPRFYDATSGEVLVDGVDVREMSQEDLRSKIGFVPQKTVLFSGTIEENIRYGKANATIEEVKHAATVAQAMDFINEMQDGYEHLISQGGSNISGGQKQRLSIARALVRQPEIYIFDDSFSALDFKTDARLRGALKIETSKATVLIVAQRVATVMDADRIIVIDDGIIVGMGTHKELLTSCKIYNEIVLSQLSEEELS